MAFEDHFIARARVSSKPHKKVTLDDKMAFFQQLSTLVGSGTPLLQALEIAPRRTKVSSCGKYWSKSPRAWRRAVPSTPPRAAMSASSSIIGSRSSAPVKSPAKWPWCWWSSTSRSPSRGKLAARCPGR